MNDLTCDNFAVCGNSVIGRDTMWATQQAARAHGWRIFHGPLHSGEIVFWVLCPECLGQQRRPAAPKVLEGQLDLFEVQD